MSEPDEGKLADLHDRAYAASERGDLEEASRLFAGLLQHRPDAAHYHYMRGLAHKYLLDWRASLEHNLAALAHAPEPDEGALWNAAIAATALGDWATARRLWAERGLELPGEAGPIDGDFGLAVVRLHPWNGGETVFARRIDPVRARLLNVPLPESGHRFGDIVLHDGASTGKRADSDGRMVHVFNELGRLVPSDFRTFVVFVHCARESDRDALADATAPGIGYIEDWTDSLVNLCMRCSYGTPHAHAKRADDAEWDPERNLGFAAQHRRAVEKVLDAWKRGGHGRRVDAIESREHAVPAPGAGGVWWRGPDEDDEGDAG
jgi:tetratricopeptide (TPR) repeat protein